MPARVDFSKLTLMDALDLALMIEVEAFERYTSFAEAIGRRLSNDAGSVFESMAVNEKKHGDQLTERRLALFGDKPPAIKPDDVFDVEAPEVGAPRWNMSELKACQLALAAEKKAFAFYDEALPGVTQPEVRALFAELRASAAFDLEDEDAD
jgi:rubrerythrin